MASETPKTGWYFLAIAIAIYMIIIAIKPSLLAPTLNAFFNTLKKIAPVFILVFAIMFITNYFITPKWLVKHLGKDSSIKSWFIAIVTGIISTGPIYMWYPLLSGLKEHGVRKGLIATFLYARAIKPALIPLMILYFGLAFTITLTVIMVPFSIIQGKILEKIMEVD
jgi:uncharacterized membrane protein YraQ (UPF0718 family)